MAVVLPVSARASTHWLLDPERAGTPAVWLLPAGESTGSSCVEAVTVDGSPGGPARTSEAYTSGARNWLSDSAANCVWADQAAPIASSERDILRWETCTTANPKPVDNVIIPG